MLHTHILFGHGCLNFWNRSKGPSTFTYTKDDASTPLLANFVFIFQNHKNVCLMHAWFMNFWNRSKGLFDTKTSTFAQLTEGIASRVRIQNQSRALQVGLFLKIWKFRWLKWDCPDVWIIEGMNVWMLECLDFLIRAGRCRWAYFWKVECVCGCLNVWMCGRLSLSLGES